MPIIGHTNTSAVTNALLLVYGFKQIMGPEVTLKKQPDGSKNIQTTEKVIGQLDPINPDRVMYLFRQHT